VKKRLFIAIDISDEVRRTVAHYIEELSYRFPVTLVKWERPEKLHLTLKFLGSIDEALVNRVCEVVQRNPAKTPTFTIGISGTGAFPSSKSPRVLWLGVNEPTGNLKTLAQSLNTDCENVGFEAENRPFKPHLTLARIREPRHAGELGEAHAKNSFGPIRFTCDELVLYESQLGPGSSKYLKLMTAKFGVS